MNSLMRFGVLTVLFWPIRAALYDNVASLPSLTYDFIVIGGTAPTCMLVMDLECEWCLGGTAGNVLANRLSASGEFSVLVLEAGPSYVLSSPNRHSNQFMCRDDGILNVEIPLLGPSLSPNTPYVKMTPEWSWLT